MYLGIDVSGHRRTMTCRNGVWDGYNLTHQFQDDRSTVMYGPSNHTLFDQEATLRMSPCAPVQAAAPHMLPPSHMIIQPQSQPQAYQLQPQQLVPALTQAAPSTPTPYPSSPAFGFTGCYSTTT